MLKTKQAELDLLLQQRSLQLKRRIRRVLGLALSGCSSNVQTQ